MNNLTNYLVLQSAMAELQWEGLTDEREAREAANRRDEERGRKVQGRSFGSRTDRPGPEGAGASDAPVVRTNRRQAPVRRHPGMREKPPEEE
jgi:hypothetical protein